MPFGDRRPVDEPGRGQTCQPQCLGLPFGGSGDPRCCGGGAGWARQCVEQTQGKVFEQRLLCQSRRDAGTDNGAVVAGIEAVRQLTDLDLEVCAHRVHRSGADGEITEAEGFESA